MGIDSGRDCKRAPFDDCDWWGGCDARPRFAVWRDLEAGVGGQNLRKHPNPSVGDRFGELTVRGFVVGVRGGLLRVIVQCSCGAPRHEAGISNLRSGRSTRCMRCAAVASRDTRTSKEKRYLRYAGVLPDDKHRRRLLNRISAIMQRCHNPRSKNYAGYGGRGILVHAPWRAADGRADFLRYLLTLDGWDNPHLELDRRDNNRGYEPGNLRFIERRKNARNKRTVASLQREIDSLRSDLVWAKATLHRLDIPWAPDSA